MEGREMLPPVEKLERKETRLELPSVGGTFIGILRNGDDFRGNPKQMAEAEKVPGGIEIGKLMPSAAAEARTFSEQQLESLLANLTAEEKAQVDIIVVASDAKLGSLATKDGSTPAPHQRCVETGKSVLEGIQSAMEKSGLASTQLLNFKFHKETPVTEGAQPLVLHDIEDIQMRPRTEEYFAFLKEQGKETGTNMWVAYETDVYKEKREEMGVEGPEEISKRMQAFIERAEKLASGQHQRSPGRRLLALAIAPRDVVGPWLNIQVSGLPAEGHEVPRIENLAGFGIAIDPEGKATIKLAGKQAELS